MLRATHVTSYLHTQDYPGNLKVSCHISTHIFTKNKLANQEASATSLILNTITVTISGLEPVKNSATMLAYYKIPVDLEVRIRNSHEG